VPQPVNVSVKVTSPEAIVVERPLYFQTGLAGGVDGGTDVIGATAPGTTFLFAEGTVRPGFVEFVTLQNPGAAAATVHLDFQAADDFASPVSVPGLDTVVPGSGRVTLNLNDHLAGAGISVPVNISVKVGASQPVL